MMNQIWGGSHKTPPDQTNLLFCAGRDVQRIEAADENLIFYDLWTNFAHTQMLEDQKIISEKEKHSIHQGLNHIYTLFLQKKFQLDHDKEDIHSNIEYHITHIQKIEAGKKIHIGRSRNDQVVTDMRLYLRDEMLSFSNNTMQLVGVILGIAKQNASIAMPGFTHSQPAMYSSVSHWFLSWSQALIRGIKKFLRVYDSINLNPLGAAAGFGTTWNISREKTQHYLAFKDVEKNTLDCVSNRGEAESTILSMLSILMNQFDLLAQDLILLSHPYFNFLSIDQRLTTGSSIMPQKKNPDFAEVTRSKTAACHGLLISALSLQKGMMSGYNRDSQMSKGLIMDAFREVRLVPTIYQNVLSSLEINKAIIEEKCKIGYLNAADLADWLAFQYQIAFRDSYQLISRAVDLANKKTYIPLEAINQALVEKEYQFQLSQKEYDELSIPNRLIEMKKHTGSPSAKSSQDMIESQSLDAEKISQFIKKEHDFIHKAQSRFFQSIT